MSQEKLEVLQIHVLLGKQEGIDQNAIQPAFFHRLSDTLQNFLSKEGIQYMAVTQNFVKDDKYIGASRDFALSRMG